MIHTISCLFCPSPNSFDDLEKSSITLLYYCSNCGTRYSFIYPSNQLVWVRYCQSGKTITYHLVMDYQQNWTALTRYRGDPLSGHGKVLITLETALPSISLQELPRLIKRLKKMKAFA